MTLFGQPTAHATEADRAACRALIRTGSRSFATAARLLPRALRADAFALYGFCRLSDDLIDTQPGGAGAIAALRARLDAIYRNQPFPHPVDRCLADTVRRHRLPRALPEALLDGLAMDAAGAQCATETELYAYAARVAGSVGAMMAVLMGARDPDVLARACDLGTAMQLTNIARDVGEDARAGRLYIPHAWLLQAGIAPRDFLAAPRFTPALAPLVARLLARAETLYARAEPGIARLPLACRPGILAAARIYRAIGTDLAQSGYDSIQRRARTGAAAKYRIAAGALASTAQACARPPAGLAAPALPENLFLIDAIRATPTPLPPSRSTTDRLIWAASLLAGKSPAQSTA